MEQSTSTNSTLTFSAPRGSHLGKVYLTRRTQNASTNRDCLELEDAKFSVADLKWYCGDGRVHPLYEQFKQCSFYLQFTLWNQDRDGRMVEFTGQIRSCFPLGQVAPIHPTHLEMAEDFACSWSVSVGLASENGENSSMLTRLKRYRLGDFTTAVTPELSVEQRKLLLMSMVALTLFDDWLPGLGSMSFSQLQKISTALSGAMRGDSSWKDENGENIVEGLGPFLHATQSIREEALKYATELEADYMFDAFAAHAHSYAVEACQEWKELELAEPALFRNGQASLRYFTYGFEFGLEVIMVSSGIVLDKSVRDCFLFNHFVKLCAGQLAMVNDVMSFKREMKAKETSNHIILLHVMDGLPLEAALESTLDEINSLTHQIIKLGDLLQRTFRENQQVKRAVIAAKHFVQGQYFYFPFGRYGHKFAYDCVLERD